MISTPPGTLITIEASCNGFKTAYYCVVANPLFEDKIFYVCGSWRGDPLPGVHVRMVIRVNPNGAFVLVEGWMLIDGRILIGQQIIDPRTLPP